jgi:histidine ammonia-lyase
LSVKGNGKVQDAYSLRCIPQVHGVVNDVLKFAETLLQTECNSATDNPMIFAVDPSEKQFFNRPSPSDTPPDDQDFKGDREGFIISGGNFHGEYPAKAADILTMGISEIGSISERRTERLLNPSLNAHLPAFLTKEGGLNSGLMIAQCTAAALHCENKVLTTNASCDSLPTSAGQEDHVSMGGFAARKAISVVNNVEYILAIELLAACVALDLNRPLHATVPLERVYDLVRSKVAPLTRDRYLNPDIEAVADLLRHDKVWEVVAPYVHSAYHSLDSFDLQLIDSIEKTSEHTKIRQLHTTPQTPLSKL